MGHHVRESVITAVNLAFLLIRRFVLHVSKDISLRSGVRYYLLLVFRMQMPALRTAVIAM